MKYFVVSDVHGFYSILKESLDKAGFESNNSEHTLIICGDLFDRGKEARQLIKYLNSITNKIMIRGNHEDLMYDMIYRGYPQQHDISNGTYNTAQQLAWDDIIQEVDYVKLLAIFDSITKDMIDYYETKNYIFVHGWIPVKHTYFEGESGYTYENKHQYDPNWREANTVEWEESRWFNGINEAYNGIIVPGKTVVCGHWHCSYGWARKVYEETKDYAKYKQLIDFPRWDPFQMDGVIAIDRCTALTNEMNVLVLEDEPLD